MTLGENDYLSVHLLASDQIVRFQSCLQRSHLPHRCAGILFRALRFEVNQSFGFSGMLMPSGKCIHLAAGAELELAVIDPIVQILDLYRR